MLVKVPYGHQVLEADIPAERLAGVLLPQTYHGEAPGTELVEQALAKPYGSPRLRDLAARAQTIVVVTSDHTRPVPSALTLPILLREIRSGNPNAAITILIATGLHRAPTEAEMLAKFGPELVAQEHFVAHDAQDESSLVQLEELPSGAPCFLNRLAVDADLLVAEGFIEPHFFAGFSGGRKSILPGIAGKDTILVNHSAQFIDHVCTRAGNIEGNIFHRDMMAASEQAKLQFILNVTLDEAKNVIGAFAGNHRDAFAAGVQFVENLTKLPSMQADIAITSNGGYPLDQNLYQAVKSIRTAEFAVKPGGVIIEVAACQDGLGGDSFYRILTSHTDREKILANIRATGATDTPLDQWEAQVLLRAMCHYRIILVTDGIDAATLEKMGLEGAESLEAALSKAYGYMGETAKVVVIPNGAGTYVAG